MSELKALTGEQLADELLYIIMTKSYDEFRHHEQTILDEVRERLWILDDLQD